MNPVVLACSGPQLSEVDPFVLGCPVAAISTAIKSLDQKPKYWLFGDKFNEKVFGPKGVEAMDDDSIQKVTVRGSQRKGGGRKSRRGYPGKRVDYVWRAAATPSKNLKVFETKEPLLDGGNQSVCFATQWLVTHAGHDVLIYAGSAFQTSIRQMYSWQEPKDGVKERRRPPRDVTGQTKALQRAINNLRKWTPIGKEKGIRFVNWSGSESKMADLWEPMTPGLMQEIKETASAVPN